VLVASGCKGAATAAPAATFAGASASSSSSTHAGTSSATASATADNGCPTSNTTAFAKTKFVLHTGLAFGAFHRYLCKPYKAGTFTTGSKFHRALVIGKGVGSVLFIKRELRLAILDIQANPTLCKTISAPLTALVGNVSDAASKLKSGDTSGLDSSQQAVSSIESQATSGGIAITENSNAPAK
jgi:hypothetical protein